MFVILEHLPYSLFLGPQYSLFIIFLAHYSLFIIKKGLYSLIIIPHLDPLIYDIDEWDISDTLSSSDGCVDRSATLIELAKSVWLVSSSGAE